VSQDTPNEEDDEGETGKRATTITIKAIRESTIGIGKKMV
jgi:hypothetical protein